MTTALNVTEVTFNGARRTSTGSLFQYDYGQILTFTDLELPETFEVDFAFNGCGASGRSLGENNQVLIPDIYLQYNGTLMGYIFLHEGDEDGETVYVFSVPIIKRPEPTDSVPTPVEHSVITELIERMNTAVEEAEQSAEEAKEAAESVTTDIVHNLKDGSADQSIRQTSSSVEGSDYTIGRYASAFGSGSKSSGDASHAEGANTTASNTASHAEGRSTTASGQASHAEGYLSQATVSYAHAEGRDTRANGLASHAEGEYTSADGRAQHVFGQYNIADIPSAYNVRGEYVEIVGNGTDDNTRSNARTLDWNGNEVLAGKLTVGAEAVNANDVPTLAQVQNMTPTGIVRYDQEQSLSDYEKTTAQININAADYDTTWNAINQTVSYLTQMGKTDEQKARARANIDAASTATATTSANGLMSATDKANLDTLMDDYSSALSALGVI